VGVALAAAAIGLFFGVTWLGLLLLIIATLIGGGVGSVLVALQSRRLQSAALSSRHSSRASIAPPTDRILEQLAEAVIVMGTDGTVISVNHAAVALLGEQVRTTSPENWPTCFELRVSNGAVVCPVERFPAVRALAGKTVRDFECRVCPPQRTEGNGDCIWLSMTATPVFNDSGEPFACVMVIRDRTLSKRIEHDLQMERQRLERQFQRQKALAGIELAISEPGELQIVLDRISDRARELLPAMAARVVGQQPDGDGLVVLSRARQDLPAAAPDRVIRDEGGSTSWIIQRGKAVTVADVAIDPFPNNASLPDGCCSYAAVPIVDDRSAIGVLYVFDWAPREYSQDDLDFLSALANRASAAIVKVRMYERLRAAQVMLARHHEALEQLVQTRTAELETSHEKLRRSELLASVGTLAAGLGHDMTNVLFPLRCRLDVLDWDELPEDASKALESVARSVDYLQQLGKALRELVQCPDEDVPHQQVATTLTSWWGQAAPIFEQAVPRRIALEEDLEPDLPDLAVPPYRLTQAVLNLVMNSSDAMPDGGRVRVWARNSDDRFVEVGVTDDGPGMDADVRAHAFEPFFTTKPRGLGTGLGLSLVHRTVLACRGEITINSEPGAGTTIVMRLPLAVPVRSLQPEIPSQNRAVVSLSNARDAASVTGLLRLAGYAVRLGSDPADSRVWVTDGSKNRLATARSWLDADEDRRIMVLGAGTPDWVRLGAVVVDRPEDLDTICTAVGEITSVAGALS
jgi:signal transduction histidine kinase/PAS domain-containing protein